MNLRATSLIISMAALWGCSDIEKHSTLSEKENHKTSSNPDVEIQIPSPERLKVDTHYTLLNPSERTHAPVGKIEILEFFNYSCPHCSALEPKLKDWIVLNQEKVELTRIPVVYDVPFHKPNARLYYALLMVNRPELHQEVFDSIHVMHRQIVSTNDDETKALLPIFAREHNLNEVALLNAYFSGEVSRNLEEAKRLTKQYKVELFPTLIVAGKYHVDPAKNFRSSHLIQIVDGLVTLEARKLSSDRKVTEQRVPKLSSVTLN